MIKTISTVKQYTIPNFQVKIQEESEVKRCGFKAIRKQHESKNDQYNHYNLNYGKIDNNQNSIILSTQESSETYLFQKYQQNSNVILENCQDSVLEQQILVTKPLEHSESTTTDILKQSVNSVSDLRKQIQNLNIYLGQSDFYEDQELSSQQQNEQCGLQYKNNGTDIIIKNTGSGSLLHKKKIYKTKKQQMLEKIQDKSKILTCNWDGTCKYKTLKRRLLLQHQRRQHKASKIFKGNLQCEKCKASFHIQKALEYHMAKNH